MWIADGFFGLLQEKAGPLGSEYPVYTNTENRMITVRCFLFAYNRGILKSGSRVSVT